MHQFSVASNISVRDDLNSVNILKEKDLRGSLFCDLHLKVKPFEYLELTISRMLLWRYVIFFLKLFTKIFSKSEPTFCYIYLTNLRRLITIRKSHSIQRISE